MYTSLLKALVLSLKDLPNNNKKRKLKKFRLQKPNWCKYLFLTNPCSQSINANNEVIKKEAHEHAKKMKSAKDDINHAQDDLENAKQDLRNANKSRDASKEDKGKRTQELEEM